MSYNFPLPPLYGLNFHPNDENGNVFGGFFPGRFPLPVIVQAPSSSGTFDSGSPPTSPSGSSELEEEDEEDDEEEEEDEEEGYSSEDQRSASEHGAPSSDRVSRSGPTSPQQPSTPDSAESYLAHYAANLPPSPIRHHYAGSFYPGQAMVQTRSSSRTYDQPP
ncbi:hypothetical protein BZA05DRAFT_396407, partial [Tricharina praecox]|uniref:uncharacterized protein n=1 Tax=Tricharina praecox TaxID=43433 RepID=UPI002220574B